MKKYFKLENFKPIVNTNNIIDTFDDIQYIIDTTYSCWKNEIPCIIYYKNTLDENIYKNDSNIESGINIYFNQKKTHVTWEKYFEINHFVSKTYIPERNFSMNNDLFNLFFLKLIDKNINRLDDEDDVSLISSQGDSIFGIYHSYRENVNNSIYYLYFSFSIGTFVLYKVIEKDNYVVGKMTPWIKYIDETDSLNYNNNTFKCPNSFKKIKDRIFGIKKREITIVEKGDTGNIEKRYINESYKNFCERYKNEIVVVVKLDKYISQHILKNLYSYLTKKYAILISDRNFIIYNPVNIDNIDSYFSLYVKIVDAKSYLYIHISQSISYMLEYIMISIEEFFDQLSSKNVLEVENCVIKFNNGDGKIHIISELWYLMRCIIMFVPKVCRNIKDIGVDDEYYNLTYKFTKDEVKRLWENKNSAFVDNREYLKAMMIKTLGVFVENMGIIITENNDYDYIPLVADMSNEYILKLFDKNKKAILCKKFLLSLLCTLFVNVDINKELPIIFINMINIGKSRLQIEKMYGRCRNKNIPIIINIFYSEEELSIGIYYKGNYGKIKYIYNELIKELIEK